ncbi:MAG: DNA damage-inducible protein D [Alphaproteobacteria bacterium]|nr:DNA damage-inducible protein D [Alphaproteobacteria bacterium]
MKDDLPSDPRYRNTMNRLEAAKRTAENGADYWFAREIQGILGYVEFRNFEGVMERARTSMSSNGIEPSHHLVETTRMMKIGKGAKRKDRDFFLSRAACYLIAMNGEPSKPEIAAAQAYFAIQTRAREIEQAQSEDEKRLEERDKVTESFKAVSSAAKEAGVTGAKQRLFHNARYEGLYRLTSRQYRNEKGFGADENAFDRMGVLELSANDFQMNLAAETIQKEIIEGEVTAIRKNKEIAMRVRRTMINSGSVPPEQLPLAEPIKEVRKRIKASKKANPRLPNAS